LPVRTLPLPHAGLPTHTFSSYGSTVYACTLVRFTRLLYVACGSDVVTVHTTFTVDSRTLVAVMIRLRCSCCLRLPFPVTVCDCSLYGCVYVATVCVDWLIARYRVTIYVWRLRARVTITTVRYLSRCVPRSAFWFVAHRFVLPTRVYAYVVALPVVGCCRIRRYGLRWFGYAVTLLFTPLVVAGCSLITALDVGFTVVTTPVGCAAVTFGSQLPWFVGLLFCGLPTLRSRDAFVTWLVDYLPVTAPRLPHHTGLPLRSAVGCWLRIWLVVGCYVTHFGCCLRVTFSFVYLPTCHCGYVRCYITPRCILWFPHRVTFTALFLQLRCRLVTVTFTVTVAFDLLHDLRFTGYRLLRLLLFTVPLCGLPLRLTRLH